MCSSLEMVSCILIAGGYKTSTVEILAGNLKINVFPKLPTEIENPSMILHNETILLCEGKTDVRKCLQLDHGTWNHYSTFNTPRWGHSSVSTQSATFIFGGDRARTTYEYLPKGSTTWVKGKNEIPGGFSEGCAIAIKSEEEIWLIGGDDTERRILVFNVKNHTFKALHSQLNVGRICHRSAYIPNTNKIIITGGLDIHSPYGIYLDTYGTCLDSTEILDTETGNVTMANPMNSKRMSHGMGVITINGVEKLAVFGGRFEDMEHGKTRLNCVEVFNNQTEKWETTNIKLKEANHDFGFLSVKLRDVIENRKKCN